MNEPQSGVEDQEGYHRLAEKARHAKLMAGVALGMAVVALAAAAFAVSSQEPLLGSKWSLYTRTYGGVMTVRRNLTREQCEEAARVETPVGALTRNNIMETQCAPD